MKIEFDTAAAEQVISFNQQENIVNIYRDWPPTV